MKSILSLLPVVAALALSACKDSAPAAEKPSVTKENVMGEGNAPIPKFGDKKPAEVAKTK